MTPFLISRQLPVPLRRIGSWLLVVGILFLPIRSSIAGIASVSGNAQNPVISNNVTEGQFESNLVSGFNEQQVVSISGNTVAVDFLMTAGDVGNQFFGVDFPSSNPIFLDEGTYNSQLLHFDPIGNDGETTDATFVFDGNIIGVIANTTFLIGSDSVFGVPGTTYESDLTRRFESANQGASADAFTLTSLNSMTIDFSYVLDGHMDDLRVITTAVDFPSNASFSTGSDQNVLDVDFGTVSPYSATLPIGFQVANLSGGGVTANLDLLSISGVGDTGTLTTDLAPFANLNPGAFLDFDALIDTSVLGVYDASYELSFTDILGTNQTLTLNLSGEVVLPADDPSIPDLIYNAATGEVILDPDASSIIGYVLKNTSGGFLAGGHTPILGGVATSLPSEISEASFGGPAVPASIGDVFPTGMDITQLFNFLSGNEVSRALGSPIVPFDLIVIGDTPAVPEPSTYAMAVMGLLALGFVARRRRHV